MTEIIITISKLLPDCGGGADLFSFPTSVQQPKTIYGMDKTPDHYIFSLNNCIRLNSQKKRIGV